MGDYHDHPLKKDPLLLVYIFEKFTSELLNFYKLDPSHYSSSHGLSWDAMLKMTGVKLELISDMQKYLFIDQGLRRGTSYICEATNKYMKHYDPTEEKKFKMYLDANSLYG